MCQINLSLILVIIGALFLLGSKEVLAGDCGWGGPFLENTEQADLIIRGKILTSHEKSALFPSGSLEIEVLEVYTGTFDNSKLRTTNDPFGGIFLVGTEWILALKQGSKGDYIILDCWSSYLKIESSVVGSLRNTPERDAKQRVGLDEFNNLLQREDSPLLNSYKEGEQAGLQQCKAWYEPKNGILHIPAVNVREASGNLVTYEVTLIQRLPSFIFDLDLNSVKVHQQ